MLSELEILISGGSDKDLRIWDLAEMRSKDRTRVEETNKSESLVEKVDQVVEQAKEALNLKDEEPVAVGSSSSSLPFLKSLRGQHTRPIEALAYYAILKVEDHNEGAEPTGRYALWSADSMGRICIWELRRDTSGFKTAFKYTWLAHETAIYEVRMAEEECWTGKR